MIVKLAEGMCSFSFGQILCKCNLVNWAKISYSHFLQVFKFEDKRSFHSTKLVSCKQSSLVTTNTTMHT
jgi:hypothetical protein